MADHTSSQEDRIIGEAEHITNIVSGLFEIIERLDGEIDRLLQELAEANARINELEREAEDHA